MTLEAHGIRGQNLRLIECPACGHEIPATPGGRNGPSDHIATHAPEDFGLTPLRGDGGGFGVSQQPRNRELGEHLEDLVITQVSELERARDRVDDPHWPWDAVTTTRIPSSHDHCIVLEVLEIPADTPIEIKAAKLETSNGSQRDTPGRFYLRSTQHDDLDQANAAYAFTVYHEPDDTPEIAAIALLPARRVQDLIEWYDVDARGVSVAKLAWPRVLPQRTVMNA